MGGEGREAVVGLLRVSISEFLRNSYVVGGGVRVVLFCFVLFYFPLQVSTWVVRIDLSC